MKYLLFSLGVCSIMITQSLLTSCGNRASDSTQVMEADPPAEMIAQPEPADQTFYIVPETSEIYWEGYKPALNVTHTGTVGISDGKMQVHDGLISGGTFVIDFRTITSTNLGEDDKARLEGHLKGTSPGKEDDFFNVNKFPTGTFEILKTGELVGDKEWNTLVYGNLTIKGITKYIGFKAYVNFGNGKLIARTPLFKIDRTQWGIHILSKKFYSNLLDNFVDDQIGIRINLNAAAGKDI